MKALYREDALEVSGENGTDGVRSSTYCRSLAFMILIQWVFLGLSILGLHGPSRIRQDQPSSCVLNFGNGDPVVALRV